MTTRRDFLRNGWKVGTTLLALAATWTLWESLRPLSTSSSSGLVDLGNQANFAAGTATYVPEGRLYAVNTGTTYLALSQKCPHLGCKIPPLCQSSGYFECACHGSAFDITGAWVKGPAPRGMDQFKLTAVGDSLVANTKDLIPGPDHGSSLPPKGPPCSSGG